MIESRTKTYRTAAEAAAKAAELDRMGYVKVTSLAKLQAGQYRRRLTASQPMTARPDIDGVVVEWCDRS